MPELDKLYLFRMIHIENIPHVLEQGITHRTSANGNPNFVPIGDSSLIDTRSKHLILSGQRLGDFIPFYFGPRMPMLYVIQKGFNNVQPISAEKIVYCITSVADVIDCSSVDFVFTDGHAVDALSSFYTPAHIAQIKQIIDLNAINSKYWIDENDLDLKRRKEAEFLIRGDLPRSAIRGYAVYNQEAAITLTNMGVHAQQIVIRPTYYF